MTALREERLFLSMCSTRGAGRYDIAVLFPYWKIHGQVPMLLFISDGSGGTVFDKETWRKIPIEHVSQVHNGKYIELDCPH